MNGRNRGFSLVEAMAALALVALSLSVGFPAFSGALERNRVTLAQHLLLADIAMARSTAVMRGNQVVVCPRAGADRCDSSGDWSGGWLVFLDPDGDRQPGSISDILRVTDAPTGTGFVLYSSRPYLRYQKDGRSAHSNLTIHVCRQGTVAGQVVINNHGRARSARPAEGLPCPVG